MTTLKHHYYNRSLISGSDTVRSAVGGYWAFDYSNPINIASDFVAYDEAGIGNYISQVYNGTVTTASSDLMVPNIKRPVRLVGEADNIIDDYDWKNYVHSMFKIGAYTDTNFSLDVPYAPLYVKNVDYDNHDTYEVASFSYDYNYHLREYQSTIAGYVDEMLIPNYYFMLDTNLGLIDSSDLIYEYTTVNQTYDPDNLFSDIKTLYPPTYDIDASDLAPGKRHYIDKLENTQKYLLTSSLSVASITSSAVEHVTRAFQNILLNREAQANLFTTSLEYLERMPYCVKLKIPTSNDTYSTFGQMIYDTGFETLMLKYIKDSFSSPQGALTIPTQTYSLFVDRIDSDGTNPTETTREYQHSLPSVDLHTMIMETLAGAVTEGESNISIPGGQTLQTKKIINKGTVHRYSHTIPSLKMLTELNDYLENNFMFNNSADFSLEDLLSAAEQNKHTEILAYRILKATNNVPLQNYYITNSPTAANASANLDGIVVYDSQVKYNQDYTYYAFAYVLVYGYNYSYDDLLVSRQLFTGTPAEFGAAASATYDVHCLELTDTTGAPAATLFSERSEGYSWLDSTTMTDAHFASQFKYHAEFNIAAEPCIKIIEVPIYSKTVRVLDHPLPPLNISSFQRMDNSQIIGHMSSIENNIKAEFPNCYLSTDVEYRRQYLRSNDMLNFETIEQFCRSQPHSIQVFRKEEKPKTFLDFTQQDMVTAKDLTIANTSFTVSDCIYEEIVRTNKKYYYILRAVSANNTIGHVEHIIEAELVNDGGYKYAVFDSLEESDFEESVADEVSKTFKKLLQLRPDLRQLALDTNDVDFSNSVYDEYSNVKVGLSDDSIFDKPFKIRLTSKKTGRKIDLNIKYKLITQ
tara:strand:+ start:61 stop:2646 length:2586 start_codon:yes stop_codon:yes gene_type:complete